MMYNIERIRENMTRFSKLGIDLSDEMVVENISFNLSQMGEQASLAKLSEETKEKYPEVDWNSIRLLRNFIDHEYNNIPKREILDAVRIDVTKLEKILPVIYDDLRHRNNFRKD
ncbi:HepT-like ribonuclease domain-containing protein [Lactococcus insecticola]|nr:HepT-like ribonuclease domain-containing protein [Lactococcus insecticola]